MRILKLHHPTGHPYWQSDMYRVQLPDGRFLKSSDFLESNYYYASFRIFIKDGDIYIQGCHCGSGYGKVDAKEPPVLMVSRGQYDKIEYVGETLEMSDTLKKDLKDNGLS